MQMWVILYLLYSIVCRVSLDTCRFIKEIMKNDSCWKINLFVKVQFHGQIFSSKSPQTFKGRRGHDRMVVRITITYAISDYSH
jgi:hypothetical protein